MYQFEAFLACSMIGLSFLIGIVIPRFMNKKHQEKLEHFSIGLAFMVIFGMILTHIIPEISTSVVEFEMNRKWLIIIFCSVMGFVFLKLIDVFLPHHHHDHKEKNDNKHEHESHLFHVSLLTTLSLVVHNIIESTSVYTSGIYDSKSGFIMALGICLHNLPLGIGIGSGLNFNKANLKKNILIILLLVGSCFIGPLLIELFRVEMTAILITCLLCFTFGMLLYISLIELLKEIYLKRQSKNFMFILFGMGIGIVLLILMHQIH